MTMLTVSSKGWVVIPADLQRAQLYKATVLTGDPVFRALERQIAVERRPLG
jgi:hypothetical protein